MPEDGIKIPNKNESLVISANPRTAALFYDRVWSPPKTNYSTKLFDVVPDKIRFFGNTDTERAFIDSSMTSPILTEFIKTKEGWSIFSFSATGLFSYFYHCGRENINLSDEDINEHQKFIDENKAEYDENSAFIIDLLTYDIALNCCKYLEQPVNVIYKSKEARSTVHKEGSKDAILISFENLKIVDELGLTWEQVIEFRKDSEAVKKYREFYYWANTDLVGKSTSYIEDAIFTKLNKYERALKNHGIRTVLGTVYEVLNYKSFLAASGASYIMSSQGTKAELITGLSVLVGNAVVKLANMKIDFEDCQTGANSEIAWVYELKKAQKL